MDENKVKNIIENILLAGLPVKPNNMKYIAQWVTEWLRTNRLTTVDLDVAAGFRNYLESTFYIQ